MSKFYRAVRGGSYVDWKLVGLTALLLLPVFIVVGCELWHSTQ